MKDDRFEWSDAKARANLAEHKVSFETARLVFDDPRSLDGIDDRFDYGEDRFNLANRAYLKVIAVDPQFVKKALAQPPGRLR